MQCLILYLNLCLIFVISYFVCIVVFNQTGVFLPCLLSHYCRWKLSIKHYSKIIKCVWFCQIVISKHNKIWKDCIYFLCKIDLYLNQYHILSLKHLSCLSFAKFGFKMSDYSKVCWTAPYFHTKWNHWVRHHLDEC